MLSSHRSSRQAGLHRRDFLHIGYSSLFGFSLGTLGHALAWGAPDSQAARAKNVIQIFLTGGPATIDLWDLKPEAPEKVRGEFRPIETAAPGVRICEHLPRLARQMHRAALIRSVTHTIAEHTQGQAYVMTGNRPRPAAESPSLGSLSAALLPTSRGTPVNITLGRVPSSSAGELGAMYNPFEVALPDGRVAQATSEAVGLPEGFTTADLERRRQVLARLEERFTQQGPNTLPRQLQQFQHDALEILQSDRIRGALDVDREPDTTRELYGTSVAGRAALVARRLLEAGGRFVTIGFGDWDTHDNNFTRLRNTMLPQLDQALAALIEDLSSRGLLEETIVYCAGEFGRTSHINSNAGRDHWSRAMTVLLAGGGIRGGAVVGTTDEFASDPTDRPCSPDDVSATLFHQLGFAPTRQVQTPSGRMIPLFRNGTVITELL
jgi:hypothetical protein